MKTTLNKIKQCSLRKSGWKKLLKSLGKTEADDEVLELLHIIESNGFDDALWCLRAIEGRDREIRLFTIWCARQVQHLMTDQRSIDALDVAERFAYGAATKEELKAANAANAAWADEADEAAAWADEADEAAAWAAAWAAANADEAAEAAEAAARAAARAAQKTELIRICNKCEDSNHQEPR